MDVDKEVIVDSCGMHALEYEPDIPKGVQRRLRTLSIVSARSPPAVSGFPNPLHLSTAHSDVFRPKPTLRGPVGTQYASKG